MTLLSFLAFCKRVLPAVVNKSYDPFNWPSLRFACLWAALKAHRNIDNVPCWRYTSTLKNKTDDYIYLFICLTWNKFFDKAVLLPDDVSH